MVSNFIYKSEYNFGEHKALNFERDGCWSMKTKEYIQQYKWSFILHQVCYNHQDTSFTLRRVQPKKKTNSDEKYILFTMNGLYTIYENDGNRRTPPPRKKK